MDFDLEEAEFARMMLSRGAHSYVVTDHTKFWPAVAWYRWRDLRLSAIL
jgi:DeoR/GlpR family transcriptional regulator of sugar metabolism